MARGGPRPGSGPKPLSTETHILQGTFRPYRHADSDADTAQVLKGQPERNRTITRGLRLRRGVTSRACDGPHSRGPEQRATIEAPQRPALKGANNVSSG